MKKPKAKVPAVSAVAQTPVFPQTMHRIRQRTKEEAKAAKPEKRDNIFSQSRDNREDRGERQMKTSHSAQTFHAR